MLTSEQLHRIMPALPAARSAELFPHLVRAMTEFAIDPPARMAAFLAQIAHESGQLKFMEEIWGPTAAQLRYEPPSSKATSLGNTEPGDGKRFKGRGPIQITGRDNYRRVGGLLGLDLVSDPAKAALPEIGFRTAGLFWTKKGLNELADEATDDAFVEITRRINPGLLGLDERRKFYAVARAELGVPAAVATRGREAIARPARAPEPGFSRGAEDVREEAIVPPSAAAAPKTRAPKTRARKTAGVAKRRTGATKKTARAGAARKSVKKAARKPAPRKQARRKRR